MPMTAEQIKQLQKKMKVVKEAIKVARIDLNQAKRAGIPVEEHEKDLSRMEIALRGMERVYGPAR